MRMRRADVIQPRLDETETGKRAQRDQNDPADDDRLDDPAPPHARNNADYADSLRLHAPPRTRLSEAQIDQVDRAERESRWRQASLL